MRRDGAMKNPVSELRAVFCFFVCMCDSETPTFVVMSTMSHGDLRANNLQPKLKQLRVVVTTVDTAEQGAKRAKASVGEALRLCERCGQAQNVLGEAIHFFACRSVKVSLGYTLQDGIIPKKIRKEFLQLFHIKIASLIYPINCHARVSEHRKIHKIPIGEVVI